MFAAKPTPDFKKQYDELTANRSLSNSDKLHQFSDLDWERNLQEFPEFATSIGDARFDNRWTHWITAEKKIKPESTVKHE